MWNEGLFRGLGKLGDGRIPGRHRSGIKGGGRCPPYGTVIVLPVVRSCDSEQNIVIFQLIINIE